MFCGIHLGFRSEEEVSPCCSNLEPETWFFGKGFRCPERILRGVWIGGFTGIRLAFCHCLDEPSFIQSSFLECLILVLDLTKRILIPCGLYSLIFILNILLHGMYVLLSVWILTCRLPGFFLAKFFKSLAKSINSEFNVISS